MLVDSSLIAGCSLHRHLERRFHPYVLPFAVIYPAWYYVYTFKYDRFLGSEEWTFLSVVTILSVQALIWLSGHWSIQAKAVTRYTKVSVNLTLKITTDMTG